MAISAPLPPPPRRVRLSELYVRSRQAGIVVATFFGITLFSWFLIEWNRLNSMATHGVAIEGRVIHHRVDSEEGVAHFLTVSYPLPRGPQVAEFTVSADAYAAEPVGSRVLVYFDPTRPKSLSLNHVTPQDASNLRDMLFALWICGGALVLLAFGVATNEAKEQLHRLAEWELGYLSVTSVRSGGTESSIVRASGNYIDLNGITRNVIDLRMPILFKLDAPLPLLYDPSTYVACTLDSIRYAEIAEPEID